MVFSPADILLPNADDLSRWSVVACDQYTAQPEYWARVARLVGDAPSALHLVLPEGMLEQDGVHQIIESIHAKMRQYISENYFTVYRNAMFYLERTMDSGKVRRGLIGKVDLEAYDYHAGAQTPVRATEGTVIARIPPRVAVRAHAPIELPHVMLLADDPCRQVIEPLAEMKSGLDKIYDFTLMEGGGQVAAWKLDAAAVEQVSAALARLADPAAFHARHNQHDQSVFLFAAGDGNHSLATAKEHYERLKKTLPPDAAAAHPARYALVELCNLHDPSLTFEPIHRVVFGVKPRHLLAALSDAMPDGADGHALRYIHAGGAGEIAVSDAQMPLAALQTCLDDYTARHGGRIDYIHGDDVAATLGQAQDAIAFLLPVLDKRELFPAVIRDGALPRKAFSMGHAHEKRFYLEARAIV